MNVLTLLSLAVLAQSPQEQTLRRFALVVGANDGGPGRVTLRYAGTDASSVASVMTQLGGVDPRDVSALQDPTVDDLSAGLEKLSGQLTEAAKSKARLEVFFYYSGHSDEEGLLLKGGKLGYGPLRKRLEALPAEVKIAVLDSCASGALTLLKGGAPRPSFLVDASSLLTGHAFLTSASADESAQESERLKASIFTHYFLSGLRGAADVSRDGKVTLTEAYQYAFAQTLARSTKTQAGPQRPGYDIQLVGSGDLVLTDVRASTSRLVLDSDLGGRVYVLGAGGNLVVEVAKLKGKPVELGLEPGEYKVVVDEGEQHVGEAKVLLASQQSQSLSTGGLVAASLEPTVLRGDDERPYLPVDVSFFPPVSMGGMLARAPKTNFELGVVGSRVGSLRGVGVSSAFGWYEDDVLGLAVAGAFLKAGSTHALAVSGGALVSSGTTDGLIVSPVVIAGGDTHGLVVGAANVSLSNLTGLQVGAVNFVRGDVVGFQPGAVSFTGGHFKGLQAGTIAFAGGGLTGLQLGVVNIGGDVVGAQLGVINIASMVHGTQLGVLNIAQESDASIGLIDIITRGHFHLTAWGNETSVVNLAVKMGGERVYTLLSVGVDPSRVGKAYLSYGAGLGVRHRIGNWYGELELTASDPHQVGATWRSDFLDAGLRLNIGYQLAEGFAVFAGPQMHTLIAFEDLPATRLAPYSIEWGSRVALVPGVVLGVQLF
ncbi:MAG: caspase family protein [Myxococcaceae bacterium]